MGLEMHQMEVTMTFLSDEFDMEIYMEQPGMFVQKGREHLICKLKNCSID